jgi:hypothetical protein
MVADSDQQEHELQALGFDPVGYRDPDDHPQSRPRLERPTQ